LRIIADGSHLQYDIQRLGVFGHGIELASQSQKRIICIWLDTICGWWCLI